MAGSVNQSTSRKFYLFAPRSSSLLPPPKHKGTLQPISIAINLIRHFARADSKGRKGELPARHPKAFFFPLCLRYTGLWRGMLFCIAACWKLAWSEAPRPKRELEDAKIQNKGKICSNSPSAQLFLVLSLLFFVGHWLFCLGKKNLVATCSREGR